MTKFLLQALLILPFFFLSRDLLSELSIWLQVAIQFVVIFAIVVLTDTLVSKYREREKA